MPVENEDETPETPVVVVTPTENPVPVPRPEPVETMTAHLAVHPENNAQDVVNVLRVLCPEVTDKKQKETILKDALTATGHSVRFTDVQKLL